MAFEDKNAVHALLAAAEELGNIPSSEGTVESRDRATREGVIVEGRAFGPSPMADAINKMSENISLQLGNLGSMVSALADRVSAIENGQSSACTTGNINTQVLENQRKSWADRDPNEQASWPEDEDSELLGDETEIDGSKLKTVSEKTKAFLKEVFCRSIPNATRRKWRQAQGMPNCEATKCTKFDTTVKAQVSKTVKDGDRPLARLQTLILDSVGAPNHHLRRSCKRHVLIESSGGRCYNSTETAGERIRHISQERRH